MAKANSAQYATLRTVTLILRAINHKLRQRILSVLENSDGPISVTEIYVRLRIEQSVASQHLAILRKAGVVSYTTEGKFHMYEINQENLNFLINKAEEIEELFLAD